jgi:hypothetical protein
MSDIKRVTDIDTSQGSQSSSAVDFHRILDLAPDVLKKLVDSKITCPFLGSGVSMGELTVRNAAANPLLSREEVRKLGNSGGGDLGDLLADIFAYGNHSLMRGLTGQLDTPVPDDDAYSGELPKSQGSHYGDSGVLIKDPKQLASGRTREEAAQRFAKIAACSQKGMLTFADIGKLIAKDVFDDKRALVFQGESFITVAKDVAGLFTKVIPDLLKQLGNKGLAESARRDLVKQLTKILGDNNLLGSSGEFALLFAFLANKEPKLERDGHTAISLEDVRGMFIDKKFPEGWDKWPKYTSDWVLATARIAAAATEQYFKLKI